MSDKAGSPTILTAPRSRRRFLLDLGCASLGTTTLFSSLAHLGAFSSASAQTLTSAQTLDAGIKGTPGDYRALVCILLAGGNDSFNMLVPTSPNEYADYSTIRGDLALPSSSLLPISASGTGGRTFAVHPGMPGVRTLFDQGHLAFVSNVGTLVEPLTLSQYNNGTGRVPLGLFSHADQIAQWQTALPDRRSSTGWGGRLADVLSGLNADQRISMNISIAGTNVFQTGDQTVEFSLSPSGPVDIVGYGGNSLYDQLRTSSIDSMMNENYRNVLETAYGARFKKAITDNRFFGDALSSAPVPGTTFSGNPLSASLAMVARTMAARSDLGHQRQTFFVILGGWDHHDEVLNNQQAMLPMVSTALSEFYQSTVDLGIQNDVTTFTISDFGRTLTSNGRGSDHGWGGNQIVMGGAVKGGQIYGDYPRLNAGSDLDTGRGRLLPTTSVDEMFAELALWHGADASALDMVLPNVKRFYDPSSGSAPIGFLF